MRRDLCRDRSRIAISMVQHGLTCQERTQLTVPGEDPMQTRARREMMLGVAAANFSMAVRMGIVLQ